MYPNNPPTTNDLNKPAKQYRRTCPYDFEIRDNRLIIDGEDFGDVDACLAEGQKLRELVHVMHEVAIAS